MTFEEWHSKTLSTLTEPERQKLSASEKFQNAIAAKNEEEAGRIMAEVLYGNVEKKEHVQQKRKLGFVPDEEFRRIMDGL